MRTILRSLALTALAILVLYANGAFMIACPSEDSCTADYSDGAWHLREDTP